MKTNESIPRDTTDSKLGPQIVTALDALPALAVPQQPLAAKRHSWRWPLAAVGATLLAVFVVALSLPPATEGPAAGGIAMMRLAAISVDDTHRIGRIDFVEPSTGVVLGQLSTGYHPDLAVDPTGRYLFVLSSASTPGGPDPTTLAALDNRTLSEVWRITVADRMLYGLLGPSTIAVSGDGRRLYLAHMRVLGDDRADYWFTVHDVGSGAQVGRGELPACGGMHLNVTVDNRYLAVTCTHSSDVRFIRTDNYQLEAQIALPKESARGFEAVASTALTATKVIVVLRDLRVATIDIASRRLAINERWRNSAPVVLPHNLVTSQDGQQLWVPLQDGGVVTLDLRTGVRTDRTASDVNAITALGGRVYYASPTALNALEGTSPAAINTPGSSWVLWRLTPIP
jgi:DNA-binding beta-propeller fold protein YncE